MYTKEELLSMSLAQPLRSPRRRFSLTMRVQFLLVLAVVLPLFITAIGSELILRPTLLSQAESAMASDAQQHTQAIDSLFVARLEDLGLLGQFLAIESSSPATRRIENRPSMSW